jgi:hypothetical protein
MNASSCGSKVHHCGTHQQPQNPFRTQQRDDATTIMSNPIVRTCYVVAVGSLVIAVSVVAYSTYTRLPSALHSDPHRLTGVSVPAVPADLKILQPELRSRTASGGTINNNNALRSVPDARIQIAPGSSVTDKSPPQANVRTRDYGKVPDEEKSYQDQEDENEDDDVNEEEDEEGKAPDDLAELRPGDSHAKMLGETKDQVKLEMDQEGAYSNHVFGVELLEEEDEEGSQKKLTDQGAPQQDLVILLPRKSDPDTTDTASGNGTTTGGDIHPSEDAVAEN